MAKSKNRVQGSYVCDICHKSFSRSDVVTRHKNNVHFSRRASVGRQSRRRSCNYCVFSKLRCSGGVPCDNCRKRNIVCDPGPAQSSTDSHAPLNQHGETQATPIYDHPTQSLPHHIPSVEPYQYGSQDISIGSQHHPLSYAQGPVSSATHTAYNPYEPGQSSTTTPIFGTEYRFTTKYPTETDRVHASSSTSSYQNIIPQSSFDSASYTPNISTPIHPNSSPVYTQYQGSTDKGSSYYSQASSVYYGMPSGASHSSTMHMNDVHSHSGSTHPVSAEKPYSSFFMYSGQSSGLSNPASGSGYNSNDGNISSSAHTYNHEDSQDHQRTAVLDEEILSTWNSEVDWLKPKSLAPSGDNNTTSKYPVSASVPYSLISSKESF